MMDLLYMIAFMLIPIWVRGLSPLSSTQSSRTPTSRSIR